MLSCQHTWQSGRLGAAQKLFDSESAFWDDHSQPDGAGTERELKRRAALRHRADSNWRIEGLSFSEADKRANTNRRIQSKCFAEQLARGSLALRHKCIATVLPPETRVVLSSRCGSSRQCGIIDRFRFAPRGRFVIWRARAAMVVWRRQTAPNFP